MASAFVEHETKKDFRQRCFAGIRAFPSKQSERSAKDVMVRRVRRRYCFGFFAICGVDMGGEIIYFFSDETHSLDIGSLGRRPSNAVCRGRRRRGLERASERAGASQPVQRGDLPTQHRKPSANSAAYPLGKSSTGRAEGMVSNPSAGASHSLGFFPIH